ncbi:hypothetical protein KIPB_001714 [Kipferlia bialata]|uniref:Uncharacterized protein n=1 Tax=Kipferlia bialata TaxID=797122 RepID=A0A9K3GFB9_9EUKA|nr:hypothetical protein KIPB_001714 [Kipferlia bialata]|eukprot:g1714.t1
MSLSGLEFMSVLSIVLLLVILGLDAWVGVRRYLALHKNDYIEIVSKDRARKRAQRGRDEEESSELDRGEA